MLGLCDASTSLEVTVKRPPLVPFLMLAIHALVVAVHFAGASCQALPEAQASLIDNPGFEIDGDHDGRPDGWDWPAGERWTTPKSWLKRP